MILSQQLIYKKKEKKNTISNDRVYLSEAPYLLTNDIHSLWWLTSFHFEFNSATQTLDKTSTYSLQSISSSHSQKICDKQAKGLSNKHLYYQTAIDTAEKYYILFQIKQ